MKDGFEVFVEEFWVWGACCWWAAKLERREVVSSVFDFSKIGRRITVGPEDMMLLGFCEKDGLDYRGMSYEVESMSFILKETLCYYSRE